MDNDGTNDSLMMENDGKIVMGQMMGPRNEGLEGIMCMYIGSYKCIWFDQTIDYTFS